MPAKKSIHGTNEYPEIESGKYEIGYRKNGGTFEVISELTVTIPPERKATLIIDVTGEETDVEE